MHAPGWRRTVGAAGSDRVNAHRESATLFEGLHPTAIQWQCEESSHFFVCHVSPGTRLLTADSTSMPDAGLIEMVRATGH
jgi:hypothetical protein